jgi:CDP-paratose 2-epimerase
VLHCAAQPAHEYARSHPVTDFEVNVTGTVNLLDACHRYCPEAPFVYCSSSKVYGRVNEIPYVELPTRYEVVPDSRFKGVSPDGITEEFPLDGGDGRGIYGTGKAAADLLVQEYGRTYGMPTVCLRGNCMTGSGHSPAELHGFLAYLARCVMEGRAYNILGFKGKQVRDVIHSFDFVNAMNLICLSPPQPGMVYNLGGGPANSVSIVEAVHMLEGLAGTRLLTEYRDRPRKGDHRIYISDTSRFRRHYPTWEIRWNLEDICRDLLTRFDTSKVLQ